MGAGEETRRRGCEVGERWVGIESARCSSADAPLGPATAKLRLPTTLRAVVIVVGCAPPCCWPWPGSAVGACVGRRMVVSQEALTRQQWERTYQLSSHTTIRLKNSRRDEYMAPARCGERRYFNRVQEGNMGSAPWSSISEPSYHPSQITPQGPHAHRVSRMARPRGQRKAF